MRFGLWLLWGAFILSAANPEVREVYQLLDKGEKLTSSAVDNLEGRLRKKPKDAAARIQLLGYYRKDPNAENRATRSKHILWILQNDPMERLGLSKVGAGVMRLNCAGDALADKAAFDEALPLWLSIASKSSEKDPGPRKDAVAAIRYCAPAKAEELLRSAGDRAGLGDLYAQLTLGIVGEDYQGTDPTGSDPALRESPFAGQARQVLAESSEKEFLVGASSLLYKGAVLWADNKLDWDYTPLGRRVLALAKQLDPQNLRLLTLPTDLPPRGERPAMMLRIGGNVQGDKIVRQPKPQYPPEAKERGVTGTVRMETLLNVDGSVLGLRVVSGPPELVDAAVSSVRQWAYRPTLLNGKPVYVMTTIDINFTLSP